MENDTIRIDEVVISRKKLTSEPEGYKTTTIDSSSLSNYSTGSLAELLSANTTIIIKSYGMGGTATPSFRGTGAGHTLLDWNGININSPMLGQSDLSLVPAGIVDEVHILYGGASMILNNGGIGGTINLETRPEWEKETSVFLNSGAGSFGHYTGFIKVKTGNEKFQSITNAFFQNSENNFRYLNDVMSAVPVWQTRENNQVHEKGFVHELYFNSGNTTMSGRIWYQSSHRNLPSTELTQQPNSGEKQFDESLRTMVNMDMLKGKSNISFTAAWVMDRLNYFNSLASIDSRNLSKKLTLKAAFEKEITRNTKFKVVFDEQFNTINSNNYNNIKSRSTSTLSVSADHNSARFGAMLLLREMSDRSAFLIPDYSAGFQFRLASGKEYFLKAGISRNSRLASMNDLFWTPGGNPDLKNEYASMYEASYTMSQKITEPLKFTYDISIFKYLIKNMIQWHPGEYSYWTADNIQSVNSSGLESSVSADYKMNMFNAGFKANYSYTRAVNAEPKTENDASAGRQLIYVPEHQLKALINVGFGKFYTNWVSDFTGKRFIAVDNSHYLPYYLVNKILLGIKFPVKSSILDFNFGIDNIFNTNYQTIAFYPLPGRSYFIKLLIQIII